MSGNEQHTARGCGHGRNQPDLEPMTGEPGNRRNERRQYPDHTHRNSGNPRNRKSTRRLNRGTDVVECSESVTVDSNSIVRSWVAHIGPARLPSTVGAGYCTVKYFALRSDSASGTSLAGASANVRHVRSQGL